MAEPVTVIVAGTTSCIGIWVAGQLYEELLQLPPGSIVLLRAPAGRLDLGATEMLAKRLANMLGLLVEVYPPDEGPSRDTVFKRDYAMVERADHVFAYFWEDRVMEGGTGHLVEAAINRDIPTTAWAVNRENGRLTRVGDWP